MWNFEPTTDTEDFRCAFAWYLGMPSFLKQQPLWKVGEESKFISDLQSGFKYKAIENGQFKALIYTTATNVPTLAEGHLYCAGDVSFGCLAAALMYAKFDLFKQGINEILCAVHKKHLTLKKIVTSAGFQPTGFKMWNGVDEKGRLFETELFITSKDG